MVTAGVRGSSRSSRSAGDAGNGSASALQEQTQNPHTPSGRKQFRACLFRQVNANTVTEERTKTVFHPRKCGYSTRRLARFDRPASRLRCEDTCIAHGCRRGDFVDLPASRPYAPTTREPADASTRESTFRSSRKVRIALRREKGRETQIADSAR